MGALRGRWLDVGIAAVAVALASASLALGLPPENPTLAWALIVTAGGALGFVRRFPLSVFAVEIALVIATDIWLSTTGHVAPLTAAVALGAVAYSYGTVVVTGSWLVAFAAMLISVGRGSSGLLHGGDGLVRILTIGLAVSAPVAFGSYLAGLRHAATVAEERARDVEARRLVETRAAQMAERARIAGDLHDLVAHHVSAIALRAGSARYAATHAPTPDQRLAEAVGALESIHTNAREALVDLRSLLKVLRDPTNPDPTVDPERMIADAVARIRAAGLAVTVTVDERAAGAPLALRVTAARVLQEALTNALKHAGPGAEVSADVAVADRALRIEVANTVPARRPDDLPGSGHGLIGMRERVEILGGTFAAGPGDGDGWRLSVSLPVPA